MRIVSILENQLVEKRIAITPEIAKKYIALGFEISLVEKYGEHLGFKDNDYKELGVEISTNETEILSKANIIIQLGLLSDENLSNLKENQTLVGVFNPYINKGAQCWYRALIASRPSALGGCLLRLENTYEHVWR